MNYREAIQIQIAALQKVYDNAASLRDLASNDQEKEAWNNVRRSLPSVWSPLQNLDNSLTDEGAQYKLRGEYSINITPETV
jgi:hypothetical protein